MFVEIIKGIEICLLNFICLLLKYCKELPYVEVNT